MKGQITVEVIVTGAFAFCAFLVIFGFITSNGVMEAIGVVFGVIIIIVGIILAIADKVR